MKHFKKFENIYAYNNYTLSDNYILPNVSVLSDKSVYYKQKIIYDHQIEYLESTGTNNKGIQYIETGIIPDENTGIYIKVLTKGSNGNNDNYIIGCRNDSNNTRWVIGRSNIGLYYGYGSVSGTHLTFTNADNYNNLIYESKLNYLNDKKWFAKYDICTVEDQIAALSFTPQYNIRLFGSAGITADYTRAAAAIYFVKISQGSQIIMDLIPVRKDGIGYMYDKISNKLFENVGTGAFILGPDI